MKYLPLTLPGLLAVSLFCTSLLQAEDDKKAAAADDALLQKANELGKQQKYAEAETAFLAYLNKDQNVKEALRGLGMCNYFQRRFAKAVDYAKAGALLGDEPSLKLLGTLYITMSNVDGMAAIYPQLLEAKTTDPEIVGVLIGYAAILDPKQGKSVAEAAIKDADPAYLQKPEIKAYLDKLLQ